MNRFLGLASLLALLQAAAPSAGAEILLPANREAYYFFEDIDLAVAGLAASKETTLELVPRRQGMKPLAFPVRGDGSTVTLRLGSGVLAPGEYSLRLGGKDAGKITLVAEMRPSPLLLSATVAQPRTAGANFLVGNAFGFGLLDQGRPATNLRNRRSTGLQAFENAVRDGLPTLVYMYWTGYVTHKPFGSEKSWAAEDMLEATRLLSFHTAQRLRRYRRNILLVGTLDEPGLSWGKTPAGGMASGFPNWDEESWYARRGWKYTQDPASRSGADWMKYLSIRCAILREMNAQAKKDLRTVWPGVRFSTDLYAPQAILDGTDPLNQQVNDVPSTHVFLDWGTGKLGAHGGLYLEKSDDPTRKIAHAMNGQLFAPPVPQPQQRNAYRLMLNAMLAAGLHSNWWLNPTGMKNEDLAWVNAPAQRLGGLFSAFRPAGADVAVLWSFTEIGMREKDVTTREARKKTGEQIKLLIASLPDVPGAKDRLVEVNAYNIGGNYKEQVLNAHQAITRAGYPAHVLHERALHQLSRYRVLVLVGQTFDFPPDVRRALESWVAKGGQIVVDETTTVKLPGARTTRANFRDPAFRWGAYFGKAERKDHPFRNDREASSYLTNWFMDEMARAATPHLQATLRTTRARAALETDSIHLAVDRHTHGDARLYFVMNAFEKLPDIPPGQRHHLYNHAPHEATITLKEIPPNSTVYCFEGQDWSKVRELKDPRKPHRAAFEPGEMKLYLVSPQRLEDLRAAVKVRPRGLSVTLGRQPAPCPLSLTVRAPDGKNLYRVWRAGTATEGSIHFPLGGNGQPGEYQVEVQSLIPGVKGLIQKVAFRPELPAQPLTVLGEPVRVLDRETIRKFLAGKPRLVLALGAEQHRAAAEKLAAGLKAAGIEAAIRNEKDVLRKVAYPRVWNPFAIVYSPTPAERKVSGIEKRITLGTDRDGKLTARTDDGKDVSADWRQPGSLVTIAGEGFVDFTGDRELCYEPGVRLFVNKDRQVSVIRGESREVKTTAEFRKKWARPWSVLTTHHGAYQLPPQLPEAYTTDDHLVLLGDSTSSTAVAALQASELLLQTVDGKYPGPGKALVQFAWSPFAVEKNAIVVGAADPEGLARGVARLLEMVKR